jgi:peptidyl-prolyl cis-trans isomerase A (cyclophilin A)
MHSIRHLTLVLAAPLLVVGTLAAQQSAQPHSQTPFQAQTQTKPATSTATTNSATLPGAPSPQPQNQAQPATPPSPQPTGPTAVFDTSMGRMVCRLYSKLAPVTVANFIGLAEGTKTWTNPATGKLEHGKSLYDGTIFHRVIPGFMIQGGDPLGTGMGGPGYQFKDEIVPTLTFDVAGRLAMANAGPNTNGSQFFITVAPQPQLDGHYTIFGQCTPDSVIVAETITEVPRDPSNNKPLDPVTINKLSIIPPGQPLPPSPEAAASPTTAQPQSQH